MVVQKDGLKETSVSDLALWYFYKEIILYYEHDILKQPNGFRVSDALLTNFLNDIGAPFRVVSHAFLLIPPDGYKCKPEIFFYFTKKKYSTVVSFLCHLRNCFSHGHFSQITINRQDFLCLEDYDQKGKCTMISQVPYKQFFLLIETIKKIRGKERQ